MEHRYRRPLRVEQLEDRRLLAVDLELIGSHHSESMFPEVFPLGVGETIYVLNKHEEFGAELHALNTLTNELSLVVDINPGSGDSMAGSTPMVMSGDFLFLLAYDEQYGNELRIFNTVDKSLVTIDVNPGPLSSNAGYYKGLHLLDDVLYFSAYDPTHGYELRVLDTADYSYDTFDIWEGPDSSLAEADGNFTLLDGRVYFSAYDSTHGSELRVFDVEQRSVTTFDINPGTSSSEAGWKSDFVKAGDNVYFAATDHAVGNELRIFDTVQNTIATRDIRTGSESSGPGQNGGFHLIGEMLYFDALDEPSWREMRALHTVTGEFITYELRPGTATSSAAVYGGIAVVDNKLIYTANGPGIGVELCILDLSDSSFTTVDINAGTASSDPGFNFTGFHVLNSKIYFIARDEVLGQKLHVYDVATETLDVIDIPGDDTLHYWSSFARGFGKTDDRLFFAAQSEELAYNLVVVDGADDSAMAIDLNGAAIAHTPALGIANYGGKVYSTRRTGGIGDEMWVYNIDTDEFSRAFVLEPSPSLYSFRQVTQVGSLICLITVDNTTGAWLRIYDMATGTLETIDLYGDGAPISNALNQQFEVFDDRLYVVTENGIGGLELRIYDPVLRDLQVFSLGITRDMSPQIELLGASADMVYFAGTAPPVGNAVQALNTATGEITAFDVYLERWDFVLPTAVTRSFHDGLYFYGYDAMFGLELRFLDYASQEITTFDISAGPASAIASQSGHLEAIDNKLYFAARDPIQGYGLYELDVAFDAWQRVESMPYISTDWQLRAVGDQLYFEAGGTYGSFHPSTSQVVEFDFRTGTTLSVELSTLTVGNQHLFFFAHDPVHGHELRVINRNTGIGETRDLYPGVRSGSGTTFTTIEDKLYFVALGPTRYGLVAIDLVPPPPPQLPGDYNLDNIVNAADFILWRNTLGTTVAKYSGADGNGDGLVDGLDYIVWKSHFGQTFTPPAAVATSLGSPADMPSTPEEDSAGGPAAADLPAAIDRGVASRSTRWSPPGRQSFVATTPVTGDPARTKLLLAALEPRDAKPHKSPVAGLRQGMSPDAEPEELEFLELAFSQFSQEFPL